MPVVIPTVWSPFFQGFCIRKSSGETCRAFFIFAPERREYIGENILRNASNCLIKNLSETHSLPHVRNLSEMTRSDCLNGGHTCMALNDAQSHAGRAPTMPVATTAMLVGRWLSGSLHLQRVGAILHRICNAKRRG